MICYLSIVNCWQQCWNHPLADMKYKITISFCFIRLYVGAEKKDGVTCSLFCTTLRYLVCYLHNKWIIQMSLPPFHCLVSIHAGISYLWCPLFPSHRVVTLVTGRLSLGNWSVPVTFYKAITDIMWSFWSFSHYPEQTITSSVSGYARVCHE